MENVDTFQCNMFENVHATAGRCCIATYVPACVLFKLALAFFTFHELHFTLVIGKAYEQHLNLSGTQLIYFDSDLEREPVAPLL